MAMNNLMQDAKPNFKSECSYGMVIAAEKHAPGKRPHIDTLFDVLKGAGNYVRDDVIFNTIQLVSETPDLHPYVVHEAWKAIRDTVSCTDKQPLVQVSCWCIGEYGAHLLNGVSVEGETLTVSEQEVIEIYQKILSAKHMSLITKQYAIMSVTKLSTRFPNATPKIQDIIDALTCHMEIDLQQRGVEFSQLFGKFENMRSALLEPMPPMERSSVQSNNEANNELLTNGNDQSESLLGNDLADLNIGSGSSISVIGNALNSSSQSGGDSLLDLIDTAAPMTSALNSSQPSSNAKGQDSLLDLLGGLDMTSTTNNPLPPNNNLLDGLMTSVPASLPPMTSISSGLDDLLSSNNLNGHSSIPSLVGYNKHDISITFHFDRPALSNSSVVNMNLQIVNTSSSPVSDFSLQAAVPKSMQLEILAASSTDILAGGSISQVLKVNNPNKAVVKMRLKVSFQRDGQVVQDQGEVSNFPAALNQ